MSLQGAYFVLFFMIKRITSFSKWDLSSYQVPHTQLWDFWLRLEQATYNNAKQTVFKTNIHFKIRVCIPSKNLELWISNTDLKPTECLKLLQQLVARYKPVFQQHGNSPPSPTSAPRSKWPQGQSHTKPKHLRPPASSSWRAEGIAGHNLSTRTTQLRGSLATTEMLLGVTAWCALCHTVKHHCSLSAPVSSLQNHILCANPEDDNQLLF